MPACNLDSDHDRDGTGRPDRSLESGRVAVRTRSARVRDRLCGGHAITVVTVGASTTGTATRSSRRCAPGRLGQREAEGAVRGRGDVRCDRRGARRARTL